MITSSGACLSQAEPTLNTRGARAALIVEPVVRTVTELIKGKILDNFTNDGCVVLLILVNARRRKLALAREKRERWFTGSAVYVSNNGRPPIIITSEACQMPFSSIRARRLGKREVHSNLCAWRTCNLVCRRAACTGHPKIVRPHRRLRLSFGCVLSSKLERVSRRVSLSGLLYIRSLALCVVYTPLTSSVHKQGRR